ncbi:MAG: reverse transcriptase family protein [Ferruginibacter sp.]
MMSTLRTIKRKATVFSNIRSLRDFAEIIQTPVFTISLQAANPRYKIYEIPKQKGGLRIIEDPVLPLKKILRELNEYLQATYHAIRPDAVFGFCINAGLEEERNIVSNASRHLGKPWLLNIDFRDFFHSVYESDVAAIWDKHFPGFDHTLTGTLTRLTCFNQRLPMGSPTSPVLSNYAASRLDEELMQLARHSGLTYTRFADDLSFSSSYEIDTRTIGLIRDCISGCRFTINEEKVKLFSPGMEKSVTGIIVGDDRLSLPATYLVQLQQEIARLEQTLLVEARYRTGMSHKKLELFEQELRGKINFAQMVLGDTGETAGLAAQFDKALLATEDFESGNWLEMPYKYF